jgi:hypothetical protein
MTYHSMPCGQPSLTWPFVRFRGPHSQGRHLPTPLDPPCQRPLLSSQVLARVSVAFTYIFGVEAILKMVAFTPKGYWKRFPPPSPP